MSISSTYGLNLALVNSLSGQQNTLAQLSEELTSQQQHDNLTDYDPTSAHTMLDIQSAMTQKQSYLTSMQTVQTRLSVYDTSMTDMESIAEQANSIASGNSSYNAATADNLKALATNYLTSLTNDLNQQVGGRYIYAGTRYTTPPVTELTTLTSPLTGTTTTSPALAPYDTDYSNATSFTVSATPPTGNFTVGTGANQVSIPWSQVAAGGTISSVDIGGSSVALSTPIVLSAAATTSQLASNVSSLLTQAAPQVPAATGINGLTASSSGNTVTLNFNYTAPQAVTPDTVAGETTWVGGSAPDGSVTQTPNSSTTAYTNDTVLIDSNYSLSYGVSSNNPAFQNLVSSLRYIIAAVNAGQSGDTTTYASDMSQAESLGSTALSGIQALHTGVANNQNILTQQTSTQNADITALQNQLGSITNIDLTQVGTEINLLQTQLQASYSATATLEKLSLVSYL